MSIVASPREIVTSTKRARVYLRLSLAERFWSKVRKGEGCWLWAGSTDPNGYGQLRAAGRHGKLLKAHRVSMALATGSVPDDLCVLHRCDNPPCVNPAHLFLGTLSDNTRDAVQKRRMVCHVRPERVPHGETHVSAKLTAAQVIEARQLRAAGWTYTKLGAKYGVSYQAIWYLIAGKTWRRTA